MHIVLFEPEIPPNTGNIARLCAATGVHLHLVGRLGFSLEDRYLRRAGLDYWPQVQLSVHETLQDVCRIADEASCFYYLSKKGHIPYTRPSYRWGDFLVFGGETHGLPYDLLQDKPKQVLTIPLFGPVRSLNLSTAAGIVLYEALRQVKGF